MDQSDVWKGVSRTSIESTATTCKRKERLKRQIKKTNEQTARYEKEIAEQVSTDNMCVNETELKCTNSLRSSFLLDRNSRSEKGQACKGRGRNGAAVKAHGRRASLGRPIFG